MRQYLLCICALVCPLFSWGQNFAYPTPPDSVHDRQDRINYIAENFWSESEMADTLNFQHPRLMLDYLYLLKQTSQQKRHIHSFVSLACKQERTFGLILFWLDEILYVSSSPHYDEALYLQFLNEVVSSEADSVMKLIPRQRIEIILKNQVGKSAQNFSFVDKTGCLGRMYDVEAPYLLLFFNNPDCSLCRKVEDDISQNEMLQKMMDSGTLKILAITPDSDYEQWSGHEYPSNWLVGFDREKTIYSQRLYDIQRFPCMYLLDIDKRVLLKEADYPRLCKFFSSTKMRFER